MYHHFRFFVITIKVTLDLKVVPVKINRFCYYNIRFIFKDEKN